MLLVCLKIVRCDTVNQRRCSMAWAWIAWCGKKFGELDQIECKTVWFQEETNKMTQNPNRKNRERESKLASRTSERVYCHRIMLFFRKNRTSGKKIRYKLMICCFCVSVYMRLFTRISTEVLIDARKMSQSLFLVPVALAQNFECALCEPFSKKKKHHVFSLDYISCHYHYFGSKYEWMSGDIILLCCVVLSVEHEHRCQYALRMPAKTRRTKQKKKRKQEEIESHVFMLVVC